MLASKVLQGRLAKVDDVLKESGVREFQHKMYTSKGMDMSPIPIMAMNCMGGKGEALWTHHP